MAKANEKVATDMVALQEKPAYLQEMEAKGLSRGSEDVKAEDLIIPRLEIIQALSPARKKDDPAYIPGAEEGLVFNTVTRELYGRQLLVVPVLFRKEWLIWKDRKAGGGFRGAFADEISAKKQILTMEDGDKCLPIDTGQHFCLLLRPGTERVEEIVVSMAKTKMKVSRQWNSLIRLAGGDRFSRVYMLETVPETNSRNESYFNWKITALGYAPEFAHRAGETLYESVRAGRTIEADRSVDTGSAVGESEGGEI